MKFNIHAWTSVVLALFILSSCTKKLEGSGTVVSEERAIGVFSGVENDGSFKVILIKQPRYAITLQGEDNVLPEVETTVVNGILRIRFRRSNVNTKKEIIVTVAAPEINQVILRGSGEIISDDNWTSASLFVNISGSGTVRINQATAQTKALISGSGKLSIRGTTTTGIYNISGSGSIHAFDLIHDEAEGAISGSGRCEINVTQKLHAIISGSGSVVYKGNPDVNSNISGSGRVVREI